jgi:hypothetical protein
MNTESAENRVQQLSDDDVMVYIINDDTSFCPQ